MNFFEYLEEQTEQHPKIPIEELNRMYRAVSLMLDEWTAGNSQVGDNVFDLLKIIQKAVKDYNFKPKVEFFEVPIRKQI